MISSMSSISNAVLMIDNETLADLQNKVLRKAQKLTEVEQINLENGSAGFLRNLVDSGNKHYLRSYALIRIRVNG
jgi:hypothetical protein